MANTCAPMRKVSKPLRQVPTLTLGVNSVAPLRMAEAYASFAAHGLHCAGALWGYGTAQELTAAGALRLCAHPDDLLDLIG